MSADDDLYNIQNLFWIGSWQAAINEAMGSSSADELRQRLMYRSYIGLSNYDVVLDEIDENDSSSSLQAIRLLAKYFTNSKKNFTSCFDAVSSLTSTDTVGIVKATMQANESLFDDAMKTLYEIKTLEGYAMMISCLLSINCADKANEYLQRMIREDEDSAITQLALGSVCLAKGGDDNIKEASLVYQDLVSKYGGSPKLLNGMAVCQMKIDNYEEAHSLLLESLEKNSNDRDTLVNLIACTPFVVENTDKVTNLRNRRIKLLGAATPEHPWLTALEKFEAKFDSEASTYSAKN